MASEPAFTTNTRTVQSRTERTVGRQRPELVFFDAVGTFAPSLQDIEGSAEISEWHNILYPVLTFPTETTEQAELPSASRALLEPRLREIQGVVSSWVWLDPEDLRLRVYTVVDRLDYDLESRVFAAYRLLKEKLRGLTSIECRVVPAEAAETENIVPPSAHRIA